MGRRGGVSRKSQRSQQIRERYWEKKSQHSRSLGNKRDFSDELEHWNRGFLRDVARDWLEGRGIFLGFSCSAPLRNRRGRVHVN